MVSACRRAGSPRDARHLRRTREGSGLRLLHVRRGLDRRQARGVHRDAAGRARRDGQLRADARAHVRRERRLQAPLRGSPRGQRPRAAAGGADRRRDLRQAARRLRKPGRGDAQAVRSDHARAARHARRRLEATCASSSTRWKRASAASRSKAMLKEQRAEQVRRPRRGHEGVRKDLPGRPARPGRHAAAPLPRRHEGRRLSPPSSSTRTRKRCSPTPPSRPSRPSGKWLFGPENPPPTPPGPSPRSGWPTCRLKG